VNCINLLDNTTLPAPEMVFSHLDSYSNIAPQGVTAWCWGVFGQAIATNWNVPVMLFNTAIGNTSIFGWRASANGEADPCGTNPETCMPYYYLKKTLTNYAKKTGLRAIFWQQGENDYGNFEGAGFPPEIYSANFKQLIDKSRTDFQANISWVIAKASRVGDATSTRVTSGQQIIIDSLNYNTFAGPLADNIQASYNERDTYGVHFWGQGLTDLGNSWYNAVNTPAFLANSTPQMGKFTIVGSSAIKSGDWHDASTWSNGKVPSLTDEIIICNGLIINLNSIGFLKNLDLNGELKLGTNGELKIMNN
jgi:Carbohydrate esterase, sialic acid-specific acetylesterase